MWIDKSIYKGALNSTIILIREDNESYTYPQNY